MSSPSSTPPIDPSDWAPRATRERIAMERLAAGAATDPLRAEHPSDPGGASEQPNAERHDEVRKDVDLERVENSLRWLQHQEAAMRLPRAAPLPLVPGLAPPDAPGYSREEIGLRSWKSPEPERLTAPPALTPRRYVRATLGLFIAGIVATVGYYVAKAVWWPPTNPPPAVQMAASSPPEPLASAGSVGSPEHGSIVARDDDPDTLRTSELRTTGMAQLTKLSEKEAVAMLPSGEPGTQASPSSKTIRTLDPDEIKVLVKQGEQFAAAGDLVGARVVLQRAAEAGDSTAAMALGATYDPVVLAKIGVVGFSADVEQARSWYRKAESLGSSEATRRLEALANR